MKHFAMAFPCESTRFFCLELHHRDLKQEQCQIRLNLVIAIAVAQIIFLAGIDATSKQVITSG